MVHGHVGIYINFVTLPLIVLIKIVRVIKNIFLETGFVLWKREQLRLTKLYCSWDFCRSTFQLMEEHIRSPSFLMDACFLLFYKCFSKECCLNKIIFPVTVVKILHYIQHAFSFRVQPARNMNITTIELLYYQDCFAMWPYQHVLRNLTEV